VNGLFQNAKVFRCKGAVAAGATDITDAAGVDVAPGESVTFIFDFGAITANAVTSVKAQQSSDDGSADAYADLAGSKVTVADSDDDHLVILEVVKPQERYVKPFVSRATQNAVLNGIWAVVTGVKNVPVTQPTASVIAASKQLVSPAEGTA